MVVRERGGKEAAQGGEGYGEWTEGVGESRGWQKGGGWWLWKIGGERKKKAHKHRVGGSFSAVISTSGSISLQKKGKKKKGERKAEKVAITLVLSGPTEKEKRALEGADPRAGDTTAVHRKGNKKRGKRASLAAARLPRGEKSENSKVRARFAPVRAKGGEEEKGGLSGVAVYIEGLQIGRVGRVSLMRGGRKKERVEGIGSS